MIIYLKKFVVSFLILFFLTSQSYAQTNNGLAGWWRFDEGNGSTTADSSGNGNTGTLVASPPWITGKYGDALSFNGSTQYVSVPNSSSLNIAGAITLAACVYPTSCTAGQQFQIVIWKEVQYTIVLYNNGTNCGVSWANNTNWSYIAFGAFGNVTLNTWHFIAGTQDASNNVKIYLDGQLVNSQAFGGAIVQTSAPLVIGEWPDGSTYWFHGYIDEPRIYNRVLTPGEIYELFEGGAQTHTGSLS